MDITPTMLRTLGGLFEMGGLATVAIGISDLRRRFSDRPAFIEAARATLSKAWNRLRGTQQKRVVGESAQVLASVTTRARGRVGPGRNMILEEKVAWLLRIVEQLQDTDDALADRIDSEREQRVKGLHDERTARELAAAELREEIRVLATGDLTRQFWGVVAFGVGIALQVWSQEIARWL